MPFFQSNLRKQIRNLPKILNFVKKFTIISELFTSLLTGGRFWVADEGRDVITTDGPVHQDSLLRYFSRIRFNNAERSAGPQVKCRMRPNQYALRVPISIRAQVSVPLGVLAFLDEEQCAHASAEQVALVQAAVHLGSLRCHQHKKSFQCSQFRTETGPAQS